MAASGSWVSHFGDDVDDEGELESAGVQFSQKDGLIFLIDCSKSMFIKSEEEDTPFKRCIRCAKCVTQNKIIASERDMLGVVLYATNETKNPCDFKHIYILQSLEQPGVPAIICLDEYINDESKGKALGHSDIYSLCEALWACQDMFSNSKAKLGNKRILLFTDNDDPHAKDKSLQKQVKSKVADLEGTGIELQLMHIERDDKKFDIETFYKDLLAHESDEITAMASASNKFDDLLTRVRSKEHKKRAMVRTCISLGGGLKLGVGVYNLVSSCVKQSAVKLSREKNEELKSKRNIILQDTGEALMPHDIKKYVLFGGKKIGLETDEITEIKQFGEPGFTLMGFKPLSFLQKDHFLRSANFIYPDEKTIKGSTTLFTALLEKCLEKTVMAICKFISRRNLPPMFVALVPQAEETDQGKVQVTPPGFHVVYLPFADDIRETPCDQHMPRANMDQIDKAKEVIKRLQFSFSSENFENPVLQHHYRNIEALALELDEPDEMTDYTVPDEERMKSRAGKQISEFQDLIFPEGYSTGPGSKRKAPAAGGGAAFKRTKTETTSADVDIKTEAMANRLGKLTVSVLKDFIKKTKISANGTKKADLIEAINEHCDI